MVQFVFVHGVNGPRSNAPNNSAFQSFERERMARDNDFKIVTLGGAATITDALWSIYAAHPAWNLACVPHAVLRQEAGVENLGGLGELVGAAGAPAFDPSGTSLLTAARADLDAVIGSLSSLSVQAVADDVSRSRARAFWFGAARAIQRDEVRKQLLVAANDQDFLAKLRAAAAVPDGQVSLSLADDLKSAWQTLKGGAIDLVNSPAVLAVRNTLTPHIAIFIGDVFTYLKAGPARDQIRNEILMRLLSAAKVARAGREKLVVCGHSMGGVILYDLLSDQSVLNYLSEGLGDTFSVDLLLTVGSQVALFEELKVFNTSRPNYSSADKNKMVKPPGAVLWWNVFNRLDVLSFLAEPVFEGVEDFEANTIAGVVDAHGAYFTNMVFYARLNARMKQAGLLA
jgi:hypothetical protein